MGTRYVFVSRFYFPLMFGVDLDLLVQAGRKKCGWSD